MKLFVGCVVSAGLLTMATAANAQALQPYRSGASPYVAASDVGGPNAGGTYAAGPSYAAGPYPSMPRDASPPYDALPLLPPQQVYAILRDSGFSPLGVPQQRGFVYTIAAIDPDGEDGRLVIDARSGRILRFMAAYRMGDRMGQAIATSYGSAGPLPPPPDMRGAPRPPLPVLPRVASRTPSVPLPKAPPPRAVVEPKLEVKPLASKPAPSPAQQSAAVQPKPVETPVVAAPAAAASVPAAPAEATPSAVQPTQAMPPAQGLE